MMTEKSLCRKHLRSVYHGAFPTGPSTARFYVLSFGKAFESGHGWGGVERGGGDQRGGTEEGEESS